ncbi:hypothetical protein HYW35_03900 [Candidatus Saccharibacteria bacterium]|nr:hypothetical protein [Candidatus Saccharibacteria bacterium]
MPEHELVDQPDQRPFGSVVEQLQAAVDDPQQLDLAVKAALAKVSNYTSETIAAGKDVQPEHAEMLYQHGFTVLKRELSPELVSSFIQQASAELSRKHQETGQAVYQQPFIEAFEAAFAKEIEFDKELGKILVEDSAEVAALPDNDAGAQKEVTAPAPISDDDREFEAWRAGEGNEGAIPEPSDKSKAVAWGAETEENEAKEPEKSDKEIEFEQALAECQDAVQLRTLIEERAAMIKAEIDQRSIDAKEMIYLKDNNDAHILKTAEAMITAGNLPRALSLLTQEGISEQRKEALLTAIESQLADSAASWLRGRHYYYLQEAQSAIDGMPLPDSDKAQIRAYLDADIFKIISNAASRANEGDEIESDIQSSRALDALAYISDPALAVKIKEILELKEPPAIPVNIEEDLVPSTITTIEPPADASMKEWKEWYLTTPVENLSDKDFEHYLLIKLTEGKRIIQNGSFRAYDDLGLRDRKAFSVVKNIERKISYKSTKNHDPYNILKRAFKRLDKKVPKDELGLAKASFCPIVLGLADSILKHAPKRQTLEITSGKAIQLINEFASDEGSAHIMREALDLEILITARRAHQNMNYPGQDDTGGDPLEIVKHASSERVAKRMLQALGISPAGTEGSNSPVAR